MRAATLQLTSFGPLAAPVPHFVESLEKRSVGRMGAEHTALHSDHLQGGKVIGVVGGAGAVGEQ
ncbi:hypothetical protein MMRN_27410 [Mycobacterium marinum]|nr:hypothetical protein MMRN_27410 [Mycobacterium marinum]